MNPVYLPDTRCADRYHVSRATIWRWVAQGAFPPPVKFSPGCTRWKLDEILKWESTREKAAARQ